MSEIDICNQALAAIGTRSTISSIQPSDGSNEANACTLLYYPTRNALLRAAHWDFARAQLSLTQLKSAYDTPNTCPVPFAYEYAYPSDCQKMRFLLPYLNTGTGINPPLTSAPQFSAPGCLWWNNPIRFFVATDKDITNNDQTVILTNQPNAIGVYTKLITNTDLWDSQFQEAMVAALAARLVPALALNLSLMKGQIEIAKAIIDAARVTNGNEGPMLQDSIPDWIRVRNNFGFDNGLGYYWQGWGAYPFAVF